MKRVIQFVLSCVVLAAGTFAFGGEVVDGVVASVNRQPILRSDWDEGARFEAFMQQKSLDQVTEADHLLALQHLIDRQLLKAQMGNVEYMLPNEDELRKDIGKLRAQVPNGTDDGAWQKLLAGYGLTEGALKEHMRNEFQVMNFIEVRLRPTVHVPEEDVEAYYQNQLIPDLRKNGGAEVPLTEVAPRIRELLTQQHMDELLDVWLHNLRQQADIQSNVSIPGVNAPADAASASGTN